MYSRYKIIFYSFNNGKRYQYKHIGQLSSSRIIYKSLSSVCPVPRVPITSCLFNPLPFQPPPIGLSFTIVWSSRVTTNSLPLDRQKRQSRLIATHTVRSLVTRDPIVGEPANTFAPVVLPVA